MPFLDIFSKSKENKQENQEKIKIIADIREKNSLVPSYLAEQDIEVVFKHLKVADFLIGNTAIERKSSSDFISSMINKRLSSQLEEIKQYPNYLLIIEGNPLDSDFANKNAIRGFILSILNNYKVPILYSNDEKETAIYLSLLAKKKEQESGIRASKIPLTKKEKLQYILEGFPNIGSKTAKKLLKKYKTLNNIFSSQSLEQDIGKKSESFKLLKEEY